MSDEERLLDLQAKLLALCGKARAMGYLATGDEKKYEELLYEIYRLKGRPVDLLKVSPK